MRQNLAAHAATQNRSSHSARTPRAVQPTSPRVGIALAQHSAERASEDECRSLSEMYISGAP